MTFPSAGSSDEPSLEPFKHHADPTRQADRRSTARFPTRRIDITLRPRGHLQHMDAEVLDFNRFGLAVVTRNRLAVDRLVYLNMACGSVRVTRVVGVVHNVTQHDDGYRCGIRFRTQSRLQQEPEFVEANLIALEASIQDQSAPVVDTGPAASAVY